MFLFFCWPFFRISISLSRSTLTGSHHFSQSSSQLGDFLSAADASDLDCMLLLHLLLLLRCLLQSCQTFFFSVLGSKQSSFGSSFDVPPVSDLKTWPRDACCAWPSGLNCAPRYFIYEIAVAVAPVKPHNLANLFELQPSG